MSKFGMKIVHMAMHERYIMKFLYGVSCKLVKTRLRKIPDKIGCQCGARMRSGVRELLGNETLYRSWK